MYVKCTERLSAGMESNRKFTGETQTTLGLIAVPSFEVNSSQFMSNSHRQDGDDR
jgi:hypothetical protein